LHKASIVYPIYRNKITRKIKEKGKLKEKPLSSHESVEEVRWVGWSLWSEGFLEKVSSEFKVKKVGVMDGDSGDDGRDELG